MRRTDMKEMDSGFAHYKHNSLTSSQGSTQIEKIYKARTGFK